MAEMSQAEMARRMDEMYAPILIEQHRRLVEHADYARQGQKLDASRVADIEHIAFQGYQNDTFDKMKPTVAAMVRLILELRPHLPPDADIDWEDFEGET